MVNLFVAVTDGDWFSYLAGQAALEEVNFWQPGGQTDFKALQPGELFLFKLHSPRNFIVGGGIFALRSFLPVSLAWDAFEVRNGADSLQQMRARIARYRRTKDEPHADYQIGCRILEQPFFFDEGSWIPVPSSWSANIVVGKTYSTDQPDGRFLWDAVHERLAAKPWGLAEEASPRFGAPTLIAPRLGQGTFRIAVTDAYGRRCAVTGERTLPVLEAAHIRPYGSGGTHEIRNGLLLRSDLHKLFDRGYVSFSPDGHLEVSRRIKEEFENGRYYYGLHGTALSLPVREELRPSQEALSWHADNVFRG